MNIGIDNLFDPTISDNTILHRNFNIGKQWVNMNRYTDVRKNKIEFITSIQWTK